MTAAVVLFAGAGGSSLGLHRAGFGVDGFDNWQPAVECHNANAMRCHLHDLAAPAGDDRVPYAPLWWASPPCQPFSAAGQGEGEFDGRDGFPWLLRLTALRLPDVLIIENVKGLTFAKHSAYFCAVLEGFRALGYYVDWRVLMCADFGVPQTRERCIIVCRRDGEPIAWPMPTHCETGGMFTQRWVSMADALGWNASDALGWNASDALGYARGAGMNERHGERKPVSATSPSHTMTGNLKDFRRVMLDRRQSPGMAPPVSASRPAPAVVTVGGQWVWTDACGKIESRVSVNECAALQGFPADWHWTGNKTQQAKMIGNAVPPALAEAVVSVNRPVMERAA